MNFLTNFANRYHRLLMTLGVMLVLYTLFALYRFDIFLWFCENESNSPACAQVGLLAKDQGNDKMAKYYLNQSCDLGYGLGCFRLSEIYQASGETEQAKIYLAKACKLDFTLACPKSE